MTQTLFAHVVDCIIDNNRINGGQWSDWDDGIHAVELYISSFDDEYSGEEKELCIELLDKIIKSNGADLNAATTEWNKRIWGVDFGASPV